MQHTASRPDNVFNDSVIFFNCRVIIMFNNFYRNRVNRSDVNRSLKMTYIQLDIVFITRVSLQWVAFFVADSTLIANQRELRVSDTIPVG